MTPASFSCRPFTAGTPHVLQAVGTELRAELSHALKDHVASGQETLAAGALMACIKNDTLDLTRLSASMVHKALDMPAAAWIRLNLWANIQTVVLPRGALTRDVTHLYRGLDCLQNLKTLELHMDETESLRTLEGLDLGEGRRALHIRLIRPPGPSASSPASRPQGAGFDGKATSPPLSIPQQRPAATAYTAQTHDAAPILQAAAPGSDEGPCPTPQEPVRRRRVKPRRNRADTPKASTTEKGWHAVKTPVPNTAADTHRSGVGAGYQPQPQPAE